jgi:transcriptional pleiotropic regulator of transition state genes
MSDTGIVRRVDALGRIVIPMEMRRVLGVNVKDPLSISLEGDRIVLTKYRDACAICGSQKNVSYVKGRAICASCVAEVKKL